MPLTDVLRVLATALHLGLVIRLGEWLLFAGELGHGTIGREVELRELAICVAHHRFEWRTCLGSVMRCLQHD